MTVPGKDRPILITGATGFVGKHLVKELLSEGVPDGALWGTGHRSQASAQLTNYCQLDISSRQDVEACIEKTRPSVVIHLAGMAEPARAGDNPEQTWNVNVDGVRYLAGAVLEYVPDARFVFAGSAECYGKSFNKSADAIDETASLKPTSYYGTTKACADLILSQLSYDGLKAIRFRSFNHTGPGQSARYVVPAFANQIARIEAGLQEPVLRVGNLDVERDFLDVRDVVRAYAKAAMLELQDYTDAALNLCSSQALSIRSILNKLLSQSPCEIEVATDPVRVRSSLVPRVCGDDTKVRRVLDWCPEYTIEQTLADTLDWQRRQQV